MLGIGKQGKKVNKTLKENSKIQITVKITKNNVKSCRGL